MPLGLRDVVELGGVGGPYFTMVASLDLLGLCRLDAACPLLLSMNKTGPWQAAGKHAYLGLEMAQWARRVSQDSMLFAPEGQSPTFCDWKQRCANFHVRLRSFSKPVRGNKITSVQIPHLCVCCRCLVRTDLLISQAGSAYLEFMVGNNPDHVSLSVVDDEIDLDTKICSSATFLPSLGVVNVLRHVPDTAGELMCAQLLPAAHAGIKFTGALGIYFDSGGRMAFYRRWSTDCMDALRVAAATTAVQFVINGTCDLIADATECVHSACCDTEGFFKPAWETTGLFTDLWWANSSRLAVCLSSATKARTVFGSRTLEESRREPRAPQIGDRICVTAVVSQSRVVAGPHAKQCTG